MKVFAALVVVLTVALMAEVGHGWRRRGSAKLEGGKREEQGASWGQTRDKLLEVLTEVEQKREEMAARGMDNDVDEVDEMGQFRDKK